VYGTTGTDEKNVDAFCLYCAVLFLYSHPFGELAFTIETSPTQNLCWVVCQTKAVLYYRKDSMMKVHKRVLLPRIYIYE